MRTGNEFVFYGRTDLDPRASRTPVVRTIVRGCRVPTGANITRDGFVVAQLFQVGKPIVLRADAGSRLHFRGMGVIQPGAKESSRKVRYGTDFFACVVLELENEVSKGSCMGLIVSSTNRLSCASGRMI
jgi:hypothetical protein